MIIKVKNIPATTRSRVCKGMCFCTKCPFYVKERVVIDEYSYITCIVDSWYDPKEKIIDLPDEYFPTNREWLASLSNEDLARVIACKPFQGYTGLYGMSVSMVKEWLSQPCAYLMEEE